MASQVESLRHAYKGLCGLRIVFDDARDRGGFSVETVLPSRYLPELLMAAPVWFIERAETRSVVSTFDEAVEYFCDIGPTDQFAYLFQMYNLWPMAFGEFTGPDIMPLPIAELVGKVKEHFDYLVIATPYHDLASERWRDTSWTRNIDPFLFGFLRQIPELMFFLGRWSGTGLFPLVTDMIADTVEHIKKNKGRLVNFGRGSWYKEDDERAWTDVSAVNGPLLRPVSYYKPRGVFQSTRWSNKNHTAVKLADTVLKQFEKGTLLSWLRGEIN